ncbi:SPOR domain-containing protein [Paraherbaspirillum soli]|uniref:SPOR domain-containing protein n=1 Tax=Paraherbaspirillum soli TaxID=631222 RepID=A0ABW0M592_9BURK
MSKLNNKQAGGTLLGFIFGLIIGLAIAVVVAIMITKTPTPFTNKSSKAERASEPITAAPAATPAQLPDPNKSLYGNKEPSREAAKAFAPAVPETNHGGEKTPPAAKSQDKSTPAADKSSTDKAKQTAGEIAEAKSKPEGPNDDWIYYLQVGAFREQTEAESARARLALNGFEARISEHQTDNGTLFRVRIGPFSQLETMNRMRSKLSDNGVNAAVVRTAK